MDHGGMDHGSGNMDMGASCKVSMLWNWDTVDACFLSSTWHIHTTAQYAGTIIGIFCMVALIELVRRFGREYDRRCISAHLAKLSIHGTPPSASSTAQLNKSDSDGGDIARPNPFTYSYKQQLIRSLIYGTQFTAAFLTMLLGMYFNGGVLFAIFLGGTVGHFLFARDGVALLAADAGSGCCC